MGKKVFISYKYADYKVEEIPRIGWFTKVRDYVDVVMEKLGDAGNINKGESDNEDLSNLSEDEIWNRLKDRIYDSTVTIVMISPGMKEAYLSERSQWIPWEVSYSLRETNRGGRVSCTNAVLAVILPDKNGQYDYYLSECRQCSVSCRIHNRSFLFPILSDNMFNKKHIEDGKIPCQNGHLAYGGYPSYIHCVKWNDFIQNPNYPKYVGLLLIASTYHLWLF